MGVAYSRRTMTIGVGVLLLCSIAQAKKYQVKWRYALGALSYDSPSESSQVASSSLRSQLNYKLSPSLKAHTDLSLKLGTGRVQSRFGDFKPSNSLAINEARLSWNPLSFFSLHSGAINQKHLNAPLLVSSKAFPAIVEELHWKSKVSYARLRLQQAIPSSSTLSTKAVSKENTPSFYTESLILGQRVSSHLTLEGFITHYQFSDLPNTVIEQSSIYGNSIVFIGPNSPQNRFVYGFNGLVYGGHLLSQISSSMEFKLSGYILENRLAPTAYRLGREIASEVTYTKAQKTYSLKASSFFNESDSSPAFYNSSKYGHNNRNGYSLELAVAFNDHGFKIKGGYSHSGLINPSHIQEDQAHYFIHLETLYENI